MWCYGRNKERVELDLWFSKRWSSPHPHQPHPSPFPSPLEDLWQCLGWVFFCHNLGDGCYWQVLVGARITAKHSTIHNKDYPAPIVNRTMVETLRWMVALRIPKFSSGYHRLLGPSQAQSTWKEQVRKHPLHLCVVYICTFGEWRGITVFHI